MTPAEAVLRGAMRRVLEHMELVEPPDDVRVRYPLMIICGSRDCMTDVGETWI